MVSSAKDKLDKLMPEDETSKVTAITALLENPGTQKLITDEEARSFVCDYVPCGAKCCKGGHRQLGLKDIIVLIDQGKQNAINGKFPSQEICQKLYDNQHDPLLFKELYHMPQLKNHDNGICTFLQDDLTCGIYEYRPSVCRCYPIIMQNKEINGRPIPSFTVLKEAECPRDSFYLENDQANSHAKETIINSVKNSVAIKNDLFLLAHKRDELVNAGLGDYL